jgi:hydrogenase-4 transcriptional activator
MRDDHDFMLNVWREACRHVAITEFADELVKLLVERAPIGRLIFRGIDSQLSHVETLAHVETLTESPGSHLAEHHEATHHETTERWEPDDLVRLLRWCRTGKLKSRRAGVRAQHVAFTAIPRSLHGDALVAPLVSDHDIAGLVIMEAKAPHQFKVEHEGLLQAILEPLTLALDNHHRLRELHALREAAESEKRSLLNRLGREDLSEAIIGANHGLRAVMERVELVARSDVPVLLLGETGSGKEVVARAIHNRSTVCHGPFIRVNCGALPAELIDSELFGHEKGSFTGAASTRRGWFERADQGTLFLDEMGELPPAAQVRLLRVLQDGEFDRVGGEQSVKVAVRIVAATHRDLATMVQNGTFREDLWYRLSVFPIVLPPLRERTNDIQELAEHFAIRAARRFGLKLQIPTPADIALLSEYSWPGNVRELISVIDRAAILGDGERLDVAAALGGGTRGPARVSDSVSTSLGHRAASHIIPLDALVKQHIVLALKATQGRVEGSQGAAALLKINPHTLRARMRKLNIDWASIRASAR